MRYFHFLTILLAFTTHGNGVSAQSLGDLVKSSDIVAVVDVEAGNVVLDEYRGCTTVYKGQIIDAFKGSKNGQSIAFRVKESLLVGWTYLVFISDRPSSSKGKENQLDTDPDEGYGCPKSEVKSSVSTFGSDEEFAAIFELRLLPETGSRNVATFYAGPPAMLKLFSQNVEYRTFTVNRPYLSEVEAAVNTEVFEQLINELK